MTVFNMDPSFVQNFVNLDHWLFQQINGQGSNAFFDFLFPFLTDLNKQAWLPVAVLALCLIWAVKQRYRALMWIMTLVIAIGVSDLVSYRVVKPLFDRARPEQAGVPVVLRTSHHSGSSFPSNHAANAFAGATVLSSAFPVGTPFFFLLAALIAYSRVYVGVHFPGDVFAGALLGWGIGFMTKIVLNKWITKAELSEEDRFERGYKSAERTRRAELMKKTNK
jgi:undecaprenyl-diphosphatase